MPYELKIYGNIGLRLRKYLYKCPLFPTSQCYRGAYQCPCTHLMLPDYFIGGEFYTLFHELQDVALVKSIRSKRRTNDCPTTQSLRGNRREAWFSLPPDSGTPHLQASLS